MNFEPHATALVTSAWQAFEAASSIPEIKRARGLAKAARDYAYNVKAPQQTLFRAACLWIQAEFKLGVMLARMNLATAAPGNQYTGKEYLDRLHRVGGPIYLRDLDISEIQSHRSQQLAVLTAKELHRWLKQQCAAGIEPTLAGARRFAKEKLRSQPNGDGATELIANR
jgi:hypothetical protein